MDEIGDLNRFETLQRIVARLRAPDGCPWDREQTHQSIKPHLIQECFEAVAALDAGAMPKLAEELGDLLLHVALHAQMAEEAGEFTMADILAGINAKLLRRHPHVFGDAQVASADEVVAQWEEIKRGEREADGSAVEDSTRRASSLDSVPTVMPALAYAQAVSDRAARVGFDWTCADDVWPKVAEELDELRAAANDDEREHEIGDVLLAVVNLARWLDVDAETALRRANRRFVERFAVMARLGRERAIALDSLSPDEMNALWEEAKATLP